jgi:hypothetical protein
MINIRRAENFGRLMGKIAANDQFIGPKQNNSNPFGKNPTLNELWASRKQAPAGSTAALQKVQPTAPISSQANDIISGSNIPQGMRGMFPQGINNKYDEMAYNKALRDKVYGQKSFPGTGSALGEVKKEFDKNDAAVMNTMASTLGTIGGGHAIGHGLHGPVAKGIGYLADKFPLAGFAAPVGEFLAAPIANTIGHTIAGKAHELAGGHPYHTTTGRAGPAIDLARGAYALGTSPAVEDQPSGLAKVSPKKPIVNPPQSRPAVQAPPPDTFAPLSY